MRKWQLSWHRDKKRKEDDEEVKEKSKFSPTPLLPPPCEGEAGYRDLSLVRDSRRRTYIASPLQKVRGRLYVKAMLLGGKSYAFTNAYLKCHTIATSHNVKRQPNKKNRINCYALSLL